jgi:hypothetical protein
VAKVYDKIDLGWSFQGDLYLGDDGDIADTKHDPLRSAVQEVRTRVKSEQGDWKMYPELGATVRDFVGKMNNKKTAEALKTRIISALAQHGFVDPQDLKIMYAPISQDTLIVRITLRVAPTPQNANSSTIGISFLYNYTENNVLYN